MSPPEALPASGQAIIVFDGVCVLCNGWVQFLLRHDRRQHFRFAAMQSASGARLLAHHGLDPCDPMSFLLIDEHGARTDSDAVIAVLCGLGGVWRAASALRVVPGFMRDPLYRLVARNRYRWFGRKPGCVVPRDHLRHRFLSDDDPGFFSGT